MASKLRKNMINSAISTNKLNALFYLIRSLSKSEIRYFRLTSRIHDTDSRYLLLFDLMQRFALPDPASEKIIKEHFPGQTLEPARKYLYTAVMRSLRAFREQNDLDQKLFNLLTDSKILFEKGQRELYQRSLSKARKLALSHEKYDFLYLIGRLEMQFLEKTHFEGIDEQILTQKQKTVMDQLQYTSTLQEYHNLYETLIFRQLKSGTVRSEEEKSKLNDLLLEEARILRQARSNTFELRKLHLHFQSAYLRMTGSYESSLDVFVQLHQLFQQNKPLWTNDPAHYLNLLDGILTDLSEMQKTDEMGFFLTALENVSLEFPGLASQANCLKSVHEANRRIQMTQDTSEILIKMASQERSIAYLPAGHQIDFYFTLARLCYHRGDFSAALQWNKSILDQYFQSLSASQYSECRILNLMIHHALRNYDYLDYAIDSLERKLRIQKRYYPIEKFMLKVLRSFVNDRKISEKLKQEYTRIKENPYNRGIMLKFRLDEWVERNLKGITYLQHSSLK